MVSTGLKSSQREARSGQGSAQARRTLAAMDISSKERKYLIRAALKILRNPEDAEDAVQSALLKAWLHRDEFRGDCSVFTYLNACVYNQALCQLRSRRDLEGGTDRLTVVPGFDSSIDQRRLLLAADSSLAPRYKGALWLIYEGHEYTSIAIKLQVSVGGLKSELFRARRRIKARAA